MGKVNGNIIKKIQEAEVTGVREKFDEVFKTYLSCFATDREAVVIDLETRFIEDLVEKYLNCEINRSVKVKIKAKKGKIIIEKLEE